MTLFEQLNQLNACDDALLFVDGKTLKEAWATCDRGDWMLWLYARSKNFDLRKITLAKGYCAQLAIPFMKDPRSIDAVYAAINYGNGHIGRSQLDQAATAAYAAVYADAYAAATAATAADAAYAADAYAAAAAAAYAVYAYAREKERMRILKLCADICRKHLAIPII